ncbi:MAG: exodeoxyribonuclease V subunit beta, partial [Proteobacteria bacterium]|nr:exodeoxyribonuclease V subunit beta [Pseudomonadota bacterium]
EEAFVVRFNEVRQAWVSTKRDIAEILMTHEGIHRGKYRKEKIPDWIEEMDVFLATGGKHPFLFRGFEKFTRGYLAGAVKKGCDPPVHPFFDLCEELRESQTELERVYTRRLVALKARLLSEVREELVRRRRERNVQTFEDLLLQLHGALEGKGGEALTRAIRARFKAALIDEFQDTDPVQYAIFRKIFGAKEGLLFFIGDPKQAIYGFRGADIFAYLEASREVSSRYTLGENWRSEPALIGAINTLFSNAEHPFLYEEIGFEPSLPAAGKEPQCLRVEGGPALPFQVWYVDAGKWAEPGKAITKRIARQLIPRAVAAEISRLLILGKQDKAFWGERPLSEGDIAVLVRKNAEALLMQKALADLRIPSVLYSTENLFDSHEAMEMERVLTAMVEPNNEGLLRAALATDMTGVKGEELDALMADEAAWERWLVKFKAHHALWQERGFIKMFRAYLSEEGVLTRLISFPDGERRNTNVLHLMEVLHRVAVEKRLNMPGLLKWLSDQRAPQSARLAEHQLRLESDENAVKLVTIHKSKGLEYPVVFCPFTWDGSRIKHSKDPFLYHDPRDGMRLTLDLGSSEMDENRRFAEREQLAENLRLLYVALSRAKGRVYLVWGRFKDAETSAPAYLLYPPSAGQKGDDITALLEERVLNLKEGDIRHGLEEITKKAGGSIGLYEIPAQSGEPHIPFAEEKAALACRRFSGAIDRQWKISSFSALVSSHREGEAAADRDALAQPQDEEGHETLTAEEIPSGIFSFPRGTKTGTLLHDLFEHLDFAEKDALVVKRLIAEKLVEYGFEPAWEETIYELVTKVLSVSLDPGSKDFRLLHIGKGERLNELGFYFPLKRMTPGRLYDLFARHRSDLPIERIPERIGDLTFAPLRGFMKGFMDLVFRYEDRFYLVDWKSNFLGPRGEDYGPERLVTAMEEGFYTLQYHLYTVALNQYLKLRLPAYEYETHFGGVYYIFLRGVDPEKGSAFGIYRDRPSKALIDALCGELIGIS